MKKELTENDIKYPDLSMLFDGPNELAARAEALHDSIIHDLDDSSHPRLKQLETIAELLRPRYAENSRLYQHALQQSALTNLRELIESSENTDSRTKLITTIEQVQKLANQLSFTINLSLEHTDGQLSWTETAGLNSTITLNTPSQQLEELESGLSEHDMIAQLAARNYKIMKTTINQIEIKVTPYFEIKEIKEIKVTPYFDINSCIISLCRQSILSKCMPPTTTITFLTAGGI